MSEPVKAFKGIAVKKQRPQNHLGYSGNIVNLQASNGLVAEVQVNTAKMIYAKELQKTQKLYWEKNYGIRFIEKQVLKAA